MSNPERLNAALEVVENFEPQIAATAAYKAKCIDAGMSVDAAEEMAVAFHQMIMAEMAKH